jgi:hypothetical protein
MDAYVASIDFGRTNYWPLRPFGIGAQTILYQNSKNRAGGREGAPPSMRND